jgi:hypothetical protein
VPEPFARWQDDTGKLKPAFFRLVIELTVDPARGGQARQPRHGPRRVRAGHAAVRELGRRP